MSEQVRAGRFTANPEAGPVTVFLIGMRANRWWKIGKLARVGAAMPRMLAHLAKTPEAGLLGYQQWFGRTTIMEFLVMSDPLRRLVMQHAGMSELEEQARKEGMRTMYEDGLVKAMQGVTTIEEVLRVTQEA